MSEYLYAVNALASFYVGTNNAKAEAAYQRAFEASRYITSNIYNEKVLAFYVATLEDYQKLLKKLQKQADPKVAEVTKGARDKLQQLSQSVYIREQQNVQQTYQGPSTSPQ